MAYRKRSRTRSRRRSSYQSRSGFGARRSSRRGSARRMSGGRAARIELVVRNDTPLNSMSLPLGMRPADKIVPKRPL